MLKYIGLLVGVVLVFATLSFGEAGVLASVDWSGGSGDGEHSGQASNYVKNVFGTLGFHDGPSDSCYEAGGGTNESCTTSVSYPCPPSGIVVGVVATNAYLSPGGARAGWSQR